MGILRLDIIDVERFELFVSPSSEDSLDGETKRMDIDLENDLLRKKDDEEDDDDERDESDGEGGKKMRDDDEGSKDVDVEKVMKKANEVAKKTVARRPRPKLDVDRYSLSYTCSFTFDQRCPCIR